MIAYALLFLAGLAISGFTIRRGIGPFDEGLVLQAAERVAAGEMPYRDFQWAYGPAQPYLLGGAADLFGQSLLWWRVLRVVVDAAIGVMVFALVRRAAPPWLALAAWLTAVTGFAQPTDPNPMAPALACGLAALVVAAGGTPSGRRALVAGALAGLAAAWRIDFGVFALLAVVAASAQRGGALRAAGGWAAAAALAYLPFVVSIGPADAWHELIGRSLGDGAAWRLPFPVSYKGGAGSAEELKDVLDFYVPLLVMGGLAAAAIALVVRRVFEPTTLGLVALGAGGLAYLLSRVDEFHALPLIVVCAALLPLAWVAAGRHRAALLLPVVLALLLAHGVANRVSALVQPPELAKLDVPVADGVRLPPAEAAALERTFAEIQRRVPPGEPIYAITLRSDIVRLNNPMIYVLAERPNALREDFGLNAAPGKQRQLVSALARARPRALVRWTDPVSAEREPNRRGRPSGSRALDEWVAVNYRPVARHGEYVVLVPR